MEIESNRREIRIGTEDYKRVIALERYAELSTLYCTMMNFNRYHKTEEEECEGKDCFSKELISGVEKTLELTSVEMQKLQNEILQFPEGDFIVIAN